MACGAATPERVARIDRMLAEAYPSRGPGAAAIVVESGRVVLRKGYGMAQIELGVPIEPDMVFRLGSTTKQFTAACVLKLAEEGRLRLDDPISKYLPGGPGGGRVTIEQLLTHTSGVHSYVEMPAWYPHMREDWTPAQLIDFFRNEPLDFEPGTRWHYSNSGYILLGAILEKVSGKPYAELVDELIFRPLGMKDTRYGSDAPIIPHRVAGYRKGPHGILNAPFLSMTQPYSAGALVSTVDDLALWQAALDAGTLLSADSRRRMWTPVRLPDGTDTRYGFGWIIWSYEGHAIVEHGGTVNGFEASSMRLPDDRVYVALLSNCSGCADTRALALRAACLLLGLPFGERPAARAAPELLDRYAGTYRDPNGDDWIVTRKGDHLLLGAGPLSWEAWPSSGTGFFLRDSVRTVRFAVAADGTVTGMEVDEKAGPPEMAARVEP